MLQLDIVTDDSFDEETNTFVTKTHALQLEHSLLSLSKWESKHEKPFLGRDPKTEEEIFDYITMMDLGKETPPEIFHSFSVADYTKVNEYINAKHTATWFNRRDNQPPKRNSQTVTSELIYYWLTSYEIPWVVETWHINRLFTLLEVFNEERGAQDSKANKRTGGIADERRRLNEQRKAEMNTSG